MFCFVLIYSGANTATGDYYAAAAYHGYYATSNYGAAAAAAAAAASSVSTVSTTTTSPYSSQQGNNNNNLGDLSSPNGGIVGTPTTNQTLISMFPIQSSSQMNPIELTKFEIFFQKILIIIVQ